jgi:hypothetical protein
MSITLPRRENTSSEIASYWPNLVTLEVWNEFPNAVFLVTTAPALSGVRYVLRGYELPEEY